MTISRFNNKKTGQALLIITMLIATILTIFLSISFKSTIETQLTKLEEERQKALAAAQAGLEAALKRGVNVSIDSTLSPDFSGFSGSAEIQTEQINEFISPEIYKDEQYTFYLVNYDSANKTLNGNSTQQAINICFNQTSSNRSALEISLIKSDYSIKKYAYNPNGITIINNAPSSNSPPPANSCPNGETFYDQIVINASDIGINSLLLIIRLINNSSNNVSSKIGFKANANFPLQGKIIISTAKSPAGAVKKIKLFQSYPQIPSEFFVTTF